MNRSMSLPQPGGSLLEGYGSPSGVVRMSPQGHINANHAPVYGAPQPAGVAGGGVAATAIGDPAVFVSVDAMHQGPHGGGPVIAIVDQG